MWQPRAAPDHRAARPQPRSLPTAPSSSPPVPQPLSSPAPARAPAPAPAPPSTHHPALQLVLVLLVRGAHVEEAKHGVEALGQHADGHRLGPAAAVGGGPPAQRGRAAGGSAAAQRRAPGRGVRVGEWDAELPRGRPGRLRLHPQGWPARGSAERYAGPRGGGELAAARPALLTRTALPLGSPARRCTLLACCCCCCCCRQRLGRLPGGGGWWASGRSPGRRRWRSARPWPPAAQAGRQCSQMLQPCRGRRHDTLRARLAWVERMG
jgi:hypothetical protein